MGAIAPIFLMEIGKTMKSPRMIARAALMAALYTALTYLQNFLIPNSATWAIQFRASEAMCVLALFTPAAIPGLSIGCLLFNLSFAGALPLDFVVGSLATLLAAASMWQLREVKIKGIPLAGLLMPVFWNGWLVGWELTVYIGGGFWVNALSVAAGEAGVLLTLGALLYQVMKKRRLDMKMFG